MEGPGFILETLGSLPTPAGPPPSSETLQEVVSVPEKSLTISLEDRWVRGGLRDSQESLLKGSLHYWE